MIIVDTASSVAADVGKQFAPDDELGAINQATGGNPGGIGSYRPQGPQTLDELNQLRQVGPQFVAHAQAGAQAADTFNAEHPTNPNTQSYDPSFYANPATADYARTLATANPAFGLGPNANAFQSISSVINTPAEAVGGLLNAAVQPGINKLPAKVGPIPVRKPLSVGAQFATSAVPYLGADIATGGALTPVYGAQAGLQAAAIGQSYQRGEIDGKTALQQLGMTVGPFLVAPALHLAGASVSKLGEFANSDEGQAVLTKLQSERGSVKLPGEEPSQPEAGSEGAVSPAADNLPAPPQSPEDAMRSNVQQTLQGIEQKPVTEPTPSRAASGLENVLRPADEVARDAQARGASPQLTGVLQQTMNAIENRAGGEEPLLNAGTLRQTVSKAASRVTGSLPGITGKIADELQNMGLALSTDRATIVKTLATATDKAIKSDLANPDVQFTGQDATKLGQASSPEAYVFEFPQDFQGLSPQTTQLIDQLKQAQQSHFALLQAVDPTTAQSVESYLPHVYKGEDTSAIESHIPKQRGEVSVAQSRQYTDWRVAVDNGEQMQKIPFVEHVELGIKKADVGTDDALFRKAVLERFGTNDPKVAKANGMIAVRNSVMTRPEEAPWYVPREINNFIDQRYAPPSGPLAETRGIASKLKGVLTFPFDVGGLAQRLREIGTATDPITLGAGLLHHVLTSSDAESLPNAIQYARDGLPQGNAGSIASESSRLPFARGAVGTRFAELNKAPWRVLNGMRNLAHEGNLALMKAAGMDVSPDTATGVANREASAEIVRAFSGASKGAQRFGRDALEKSGLLSQQNTRALFSQLGVAGNLLRPGANTAQRLLAAKGLASLAVGIWGVGSIVNMTAGSGDPLKFPVTWDPQTKQFKYNSGWDLVQVKGVSTPMLPQASLVNAIAKAFTALGNEAAHPTQNPADALGEATKPLAQFGMGRLGPTTAPVPAALGFGYDPAGKAHFGDLTATQRLQAAFPTPIGASKVLQNPNVLNKPGELAAEQGLGSYPPSTSQPFFDARTALGKSGFPDGTLTADQQKTLSGATQTSGSTIAQARTSFVSQFESYYRTHDVKGKPLDNAVSDTEAKRVASQAFSAYPAVKALNKQLTDAEDQWAFNNPYVLLKAVEAGNIIPNAYEKSVLAWARAHPQSSP